MNESSKQHVQVPSKVETAIKPKDQLIYACIKKYMNNETMQAFPSIETISKDSGLSKNTVSKSINNLAKFGYLSISKKGRCNLYTFSRIKQFEPFSFEYITSNKITPETKASVMSMQPYMIKDTPGFGKIGYCAKTIANLIHSSERSVYRTFGELKRKGYMAELKNKETDLLNLGGSFKNTKVINLKSLGQAIIWKLKDHEDKINKNTEDIDKLKNENEEMKTEMKRLSDAFEKLNKESKGKDTFINRILQDPYFKKNYKFE